MIEPGNQVGGYALEQEIGRGGGGQIWRAHSAQNPHQVRALKLLKPLVQGEVRHDFNREVYALAKLQHPHIAHVSDVGVWHHEGERYPFIVMEFIHGETFHALAQKKVSWRVWHELVLDVLRALMHAHAVGVIHRDIKPKNVLVELDARGKRMAKLVDFGVARVVDNAPGNTSLGMTINTKRSTDGMTISGTPRYMSPEQIDARFGPVGPWSDLYALGCMMWRLLCQSGPFDGELYFLLAAHLSQEPGEFKPVIDVPVGVEAWLRWLMQKNPHERCRHAAKALAAFERLSHLGTQDTKRMKAVSPSHLDETSVAHPRRSIDELIAAVEAEELSTSGGFKRLRPHMPPQWDARTVKAKNSARDIFVNPAIWRHQPRRLVGRRQERDKLWDAMAQVVRHKRASWVSIEGPDGVGKSHLKSWFERHIRELGVAHVLSLSCQHYRQPKSVVIELIQQLLFLRGMHADYVRDEFARFFSALGVSEETARMDTAQYTALVQDSAQGGSYELQDYNELLCRLLTLLSIQGPVVLSLSGLSAHQSLLESLVHYFTCLVDTACPLLVLTTGPSPQALQHIPAERVQRVLIEKLPQSLQYRALASLLPLDRGSLQMLVARTREDLPLAIMHVHRWVHDGIFAQRQHELVLSSELLDGVAGSHVAFWAQQLHTWEADGFMEDLLSMELAALMGAAVHLDLWKACMQRAGLQSMRLYERLLDSGLLHRVGRGRWKFGAELLSRGLEERAKRAGRLESHHLVLAKTLEAYEHDDPIFMERATEHWMQCDHLPEALRTCYVAGEHHVIRSDEHALNRVILLLSKIAEMSRENRERAQVCRALFCMVLSLRSQDFTKAQEHAELCQAMARLNGWEDVRGRVLLELAVLCEQQGRFDEALELLNRASPLLAKLTHSGLNEVLNSRLARLRAHLLVMMQRSTEALVVLDELEASFGSRRGSHAHAMSLLTRAHAYQHAGDVASAQAHLEQAFPVLELSGDRHALMMGLERLAGLIDAEQPGRAQGIYERILSLSEASDKACQIRVGVSLATSCLASGDHARADAALQRVFQHDISHIPQRSYITARLASCICALELYDGNRALVQASYARDALYQRPYWEPEFDVMYQAILNHPRLEQYATLRSCVVDCRKVSHAAR